MYRFEYHYADSMPQVFSIGLGISNVISEYALSR